jgi:hypothetical protein
MWPFAFLLTKNLKGDVPLCFAHGVPINWVVRNIGGKREEAALL